MAKIISENEFSETIKEGLVLVDFYADWCGPCQQLAPILEELSAERKDLATIVKVNTDNDPDLTSSYGVMSLPTMVLFKDGEKIGQQIGVKSKDELTLWLEQNK